MRGIVSAAASAALLLLAAPPLDLAPLALLALVPLLRAARRAGVGMAAGLGWVSGVVFHVGLLLWLPATIARMQSISLPPATALFLAHVGFESLRFALLAAAARLGCTRRCDVVATSATWVLIEAAVPQPLPWSLGAALGPHPLLRQGADLAGAHGLAALVIAVNTLVATAVDDWSIRRARAGAALAIAATLLIGATAYGTWRRGSAALGYGGTGPRIAVVQAGWSAGDRRDLQHTASTWHDYARLSATLMGPVAVILWPEGALRVYLRAATDWRRSAEALARRLGAHLVIGGLDRTADGAELSAAYVFSPALSAVAHKAVLVPFGEYLPELVRGSPLRWWRPPAPRRPGPAPTAIDAGARVAPSICFEAILPGHFNAAVRAGAEVLINLSDDSWFDSAWAAAQHLEMTRLRAVETRRWLVRASHSGISAAIDARGDVVAALPYGRRGTFVQTVQRGAGLTPYARWGDAPLQTVCAAALLWIIACRRRRPHS